MKKALIVATSFALMSSSASAADVLIQETAFPKWDAFFEAYGGVHLTDVTADPFEDFPGVSASNNDIAFGGRASGAYKWANSFGIQTDLTSHRQYLGDPFGGSCQDDFGVLNGLGGLGCLIIGGEWNTTDIDAAVHLYHQRDNLLLGVIGQYGYTDLSIGILSIDWNRFYGGLEAQAYWGNLTLYGRVGYEKIDLFEEFNGLNGLIPGDALDSDGVSLMAEARYYLTDNTKLSGSVTYLVRDFGDGDTDGVFLGDVDTWSIGGKAEHRFTAIPFSVFASVDWSHTSFDDSGSSSVDSEKIMFLAGVKLNMGSNSLIDRDRNGATLDPFTNPKPLIDLIQSQGFIFDN